MVDVFELEEIEAIGVEMVAVIGEIAVCDSFVVIVSGAFKLGLIEVTDFEDEAMIDGIIVFDSFCVIIGMCFKLGVIEVIGARVIALIGTIDVVSARIVNVLVIDVICDSDVICITDGVIFWFLIELDGLIAVDREGKIAEKQNSCYQCVIKDCVGSKFNTPENVAEGGASPTLFNYLDMQ